MEPITGIHESILKNLAERSVEKRKQAQSDLQEIIEKLINNHEYTTINTKIEIFSSMITNDSH